MNNSTQDIPDLTPNQRILAQLLTEHLEFTRDLEFRAELQKIVDLFWIPRDPEKPAKLKNRVQQRGLFVYGPSGAGKSNMVRDALKNFRHSENGRSLDGWYISVDAPSPFSTLELGLTILSALGITLFSGGEREVFRMIRMMCAERGIVLIHIDEFSRWNSVKLVGTANKVGEMKRLGENLASMMTGSDWPVSLLLSGTAGALPLWSYEEMEGATRRIEPFELYPVDEAYRNSINQIFQSYLDFADCDDDLPEDYDLFGRLLRASRNRLGVMLFYMQDAIMKARAADNVVKPEFFAAYYSRRARCKPDQNLFLAKNWRVVAIPAKLDYETLR